MNIISIKEINEDVLEIKQNHLWFIYIILIAIALFIYRFVIEYNGFANNSILEIMVFLILLYCAYTFMNIMNNKETIINKKEKVIILKEKFLLKKTEKREPISKAKKILHKFNFLTPSFILLIKGKTRERIELEMNDGQKITLIESYTQIKFFGKKAQKIANFLKIPLEK